MNAMLNNIHKRLAVKSKIFILTILGLVLGGIPAIITFTQQICVLQR
jgi:hypothetical protein